MAKFNGSIKQHPARVSVVWYAAKIGQTLRQTDLRRLYNLWVIGVKDALTGKLELFPDAEYQFGADQLMIVVARQQDLKRFRQLK